MTKQTTKNKVTVFTRTPMLGNIESIECYLEKCGTTNYAQFKDCPYVIIKKPRCRKALTHLSADYDPFLVVVEGWGHNIPTAFYKDEPVRNADGLVVKQAVYGSHDPRWEKDFATQIESQSDLVYLVKIGRHFTSQVMPIKPKAAAEAPVEAAEAPVAVASQIAAEAPVAATKLKVIDDVFNDLSKKLGLDLPSELASKPAHGIKVTIEPMEVIYNRKRCGLVITGAHSSLAKQQLEAAGFRYWEKGQLKAYYLPGTKFNPQQPKACMPESKVWERIESLLLTLDGLSLPWQFESATEQAAYQAH